MKALASFAAPLRVVVVGASGGIGGAFVEALAGNPAVVELFALGRRVAGPATASDPDTTQGSRLHALHIDLEAPQTIEAAAAAVAGTAGGPLDLVIVATGLLHDNAGMRPEKSLKTLSAEGLARSMAVNAIGPALLARSFLPLLRRDAKAAFCALSARVGSIEDNRIGGWYGYRASKAALNMLLRTAAIELARTHPKAVCVGLHPGTVDTELSAPFQSTVPPGKLFTPNFSAERLLTVVDELDATDSGGLYAWDGQRIPF